MVSHSLAIDLKPANIIVLAICPGWVRTDMGGPTASILPATCVASLLKLIEGADMSKTGEFVTSSGSKIAW